jgi:uncharacterized membrane protein
MKKISTVRVNGNMIFKGHQLASIPTAATGILAWRWVLKEGQHLKGILRLHLLLGCAVVFALWLTVCLRSRLRAQAETGNSTAILASELIACAMVSLTAHLGGFSAA